jgi:hypothetical protein
MTEEALRSATSTPIPDEESAEERRILGHARTGSRGGRRSRRSSSASRPQSRGRNEIDMLPPNSSAQVFRNLLILEESLREQYKELSLSRRKHVVFFMCLLSGLVYFFYAVFIQPSIYGLFSFLQRVGFLASAITMGLFYLTGLYSKTFVEYPRFIYSTNKGLRAFNIKLVKLQKSWRERIIGLCWDPSYSDRPGKLVKIVLSTRMFTPETIEGWEIYRQEYWERELDRAVKRHQRNQSTDASKKPNRKRALSNRPNNKGLGLSEK